MSEQPLDVKSSVRAIWRRRFLVGTVGAIGLCGGVTYGLLKPQLPHADALVILPPPSLTSSEAPARDMTTQIIVATSPQVLKEASQSVSPPISATKLKQQITVKSISNQILQIQASAKKPADAITLANAVAADYSRYVNKELPNAGVGNGVQPFQPATSAVAASKLHTASSGAFGLAIGLLAGIILALVRSNRDRHLRLRDEIAGAIGVPVLTSLEAEKCISASQWERLLERYTPSAVVSWGLRRVLHRLAAISGDADEIRVVSFADDRPALAAGPQLATFAAQLGIPTALEPGDEEALVQMRAACAAHTRAGRQPELLPPGSKVPTPGKSRPASWDDDSVPVRMRPELTVSVMAVDRQHPEVAPFAGTSVLSVSSGFATAEDLAKLAMAAEDAAQAIDGILVINPDPRDSTTGVVTEVESRQPLRLRPSSPFREPGAGGLSL